MPYVLLSDFSNILPYIFISRQSKKHGVVKKASVHIMHILNVKYDNFLRLISLTCAKPVIIRISILKP